jgi:hypothetical protein
MAIPRSALDEPLLSKKQASVLREIARAAQLYQGLIELDRVQDIFLTPESRKRGGKLYPDLFHYLQSEISRTLSSIKVPKSADCDHGSSEQTR